MTGERSLYIDEEFLAELLSSPSPSGYEGEAAKIWKSYAEKFADEVYTDFHGNSFAVINPDSSPRIMLAGHIDEIGLMVVNVTDDGYLHVRPIGGYDPQVLVAQRLYILSSVTGKRVLGVIGRKPIHVLKPEERDKAVKVEDLWVDIGAEDRDDALSKVAIGDPAVLAYSFDRLNEDIIVARGIDDRIGAFVVLQALKLARELGVKSQVVAVATCQEELGLRGARTSAFRLNPHVGIAVDVTFATDAPGLKDLQKTFGKIELGKGPVIARGPNINVKLFELFKGTAEEKGIPYQVEAIPRATGTDANAIQITREGPATALISIPNRYMHTPCELVSLKDVDNAVKLIAHTVAKLEKVDQLIPF